ncbi:antibiotic biosynthesis monooxygenase [Aquamicrobium sp. LC103]|uniref:antibiotic biosynthesis monooxygenase n=1 Tax=Aquamicrobium sp. LC103 TaxID=1120658 RepID=UPI00063E9185|nr:antibiotic biosynthesis monooxygenase [Aquamicrobium sp. LC103]TKT81285.1 antibiotic biosynthesis monooxygenase [Aquamicrobium sp. LC103]
MEAASFFSIIDYAVDNPETQQAIIDAFAEVQRTWVAHHQGYVYAKFFASTDGIRVTSIVAWKSEADFVRFEEAPDGPERLAAIRRALDGLSCRGERRSFTLARAVEPRPNS